MNLINFQKDTKSKSLSEAFVNSFGGFPIGYCIGIIILPMSVGWIKDDPFTVNFLITSVYAAASFVRIYFLRRVFERSGFDDNFIRLSFKLWKQIVTRKRNINLLNKEEICVVCGKNNRRKEKKTCSDECAKTYILRIVKPDLENHSSLKSLQPVLPQDRRLSLLKLKPSWRKRQE